MPRANSFLYPEWRKINSAPKGDELFLVGIVNDERIMIVRGNILTTMLKKDTPKHLQFPATHWLPLPPPPRPEDGEHW